MPSAFANYANSGDIFTKITTEIWKIISKTYLLHFLCAVTWQTYFGVCLLFLRQQQTGGEMQRWKTHWSSCFGEWGVSALKFQKHFTPGECLTSFHLNQRRRPNVKTPMKCLWANSSDGAHLKSSSVAFWSPKLRSAAEGLGPLNVAVGAGNRSDRDTPWKSACQRALLDLLSGTQRGEPGFLTLIIWSLGGKWHREASSASCCATVKMRC